LEIFIDGTCKKSTFSDGSSSRDASLLDAGPSEYPSPLFTLIPIDVFGTPQPQITVFCIL
jgi:hypothetical protein